MDAIELLVQPDVDGNWPYRFVVRKREYIMQPGGPATFAGDGTWALFRAWNDKGKEVDVRVRAADKVTLLSRYSIASHAEYRVEKDS